MGTLLIKKTMENYQVCRATMGDIEQIISMIEYSRSLMRKRGNLSQWTGGYPSRQDVEADIRAGNSHLLRCGDAVAGTFALVEGLEPTYQIIEGGWKDAPRPYGTIHRTACAPGFHGIFAAALEWSRRQVASLRIDTHADNRVMLHLIQKLGFERCGIVYMDDGSPREAYQMLDTGCLCQPLQQHIESNIIPLYDQFDAAHRRDHAESVIAESLRLAKYYTVEVNMVYTIAAYHDVGLCQGREQHHIVSAQALQADEVLRRWFSPEQLAVMAQAIEDHRASSGQEPRSIYGKIVAEADRDIRPEKIVRRTIQYGLSHYPTLSPEQHYQRAMQHLEEKYGPFGYLRLFLPESDNATHLARLREMIADPRELRTLLEQIYQEETTMQNSNIS